MMKIILPKLMVLLCFFGCTTTSKKEIKSELIAEEISWHLRDYAKDSVSGISLEKAYEEIDNLDSGVEIIVALIDSHIDLHHEDLENQIYTNENEIPNNGIDDDKNGYIDDIHGWNFIGYKDEKNSLRYALRVHTRIVKRLDSVFKGKTVDNISPQEIKDFNKYMLSKSKLNTSIEESRIYLERFPRYKDLFKKAYETFGNKINLLEGYTEDDLNLLKPVNEDEEKIIKNLKKFLAAGVTYDYLLKEEKNDLVNIHVGNNINYNERAKIGDNPYNYDEKYYGNNFTDIHYDIDHGTQIAGILAATRNNGVGIRGISNKIKIMPLPILPEKGAENEKDFLNAVRYAVDNGARIINFSSGISIPDNEDVFFKALKYAEKNNVLIINAAGNSGLSNDIDQNNHYPRDISPKGDTVNNFIKVGASSKYSDERLFCSWSNYGRETVDLFAPGEDINTLSKNVPFVYQNNSGSSISAALTSGVAALILSKHPNLSAKKLKEIILNSGQEFDTIAITMESDTIQFSQISTSGKVLNAYNALKLAAENTKK